MGNKPGLADFVPDLLNNLQRSWVGRNDRADDLSGTGDHSIYRWMSEPIVWLFTEGIMSRTDDDESTVNMAARYEDVAEAFPEEIKGDAFPYFLDWLKYNVILVEITAYSDDNAYAIFESMNDRGLNLTSTEMLKGYVLSRFSDAEDREKANILEEGGAISAWV